MMSPLFSRMRSKRILPATLLIGGILTLGSAALMLRGNFFHAQFSPDLEQGPLTTYCLFSPPPATPATPDPWPVLQHYSGQGPCPNPITVPMGSALSPTVLAPLLQLPGGGGVQGIPPVGQSGSDPACMGGTRRPGTLICDCPPGQTCGWMIANLTNEAPPTIACEGTVVSGSAFAQTGCVCPGEPSVPEECLPVTNENGIGFICTPQSSGCPDEHCGAGGSVTCSPACSDGRDNDGDGAIDNEDTGCHPCPTGECGLDAPYDPSWISELLPCEGGPSFAQSFFGRLLGRLVALNAPPGDPCNNFIPIQRFCCIGLPGPNNFCQAKIFPQGWTNINGLSVCRNGRGALIDQTACNDFCSRDQGPCFDKPAGSLCRAADPTLCRAEAECNGTAPECLASGPAAAGIECRPEAPGGCDVAETCPGNAAACPADTKLPDGTACLPEGNICMAGSCITPSLLPNERWCCNTIAQQCRSTTSWSANNFWPWQSNVSSCNGWPFVGLPYPDNQRAECNDLCRPVANSFCCEQQQWTATCRASRVTGVDVAAGTPLCPVFVDTHGDGHTDTVYGDANCSTNNSLFTCQGEDLVTPPPPIGGGTGDSPPSTCLGGVSIGEVCRAASDACDVAALCAAGQPPTCPANVLRVNGTICRAKAAGDCDVAETCSGNSSACPTDRFIANGTSCSLNSGGMGECQGGVCSPLPPPQGFCCFYEQEGPQQCRPSPLPLGSSCPEADGLLGSVRTPIGNCMDFCPSRPPPPPQQSFMCCALREDGSIMWGYCGFRSSTPPACLPSLALVLCEDNTFNNCSPVASPPPPPPPPPPPTHCIDSAASGCNGTCSGGGQCRLSTGPGGHGGCYCALPAPPPVAEPPPEHAPTLFQRLYQLWWDAWPF